MEFSPVGDSSLTGEELQKSPENCMVRVNTRKRKNPVVASRKTCTLPAGKRRTTTKSNPRSSDNDLRHLSPVDSSESDLDLNEVRKNSSCNSASSILQEPVVYPSTSTIVNQWKSEQSFLQHQIKLLKSPFEMEECSALLSKQGLFD